MNITVIGSINLDHYHFVRDLPRPGETVHATRTQTSPGGKGANQALAAARAGASVSLIAAIGTDPAGDAYLTALKKENIDISGISRTSEAPTGSAFIAVDSHGENSIIVNPGANALLTPEILETHRHLITSAAAILLQFETPMETVIRATEIAAEAGVPVFLNPSPMPETVPWDRLKVTTLIVNQTEHARLPKNRKARVITTNGPNSTTLTNNNKIIEVPAFKVTPVDTVGAGDTFAGALATALSENLPPEEALRFANAAAALATLEPGAQEAIPSRREINDFLTQRS